MELLSDGSHIGLLIMAAFSYLAPEFIQEGRLCWLRTPLYIVQNGKKKDYYFNDNEFNAVRNKVTGTVTRAKGIGELSADIARESMFDIKHQRLDILDYSEEGIILLNELMGVDVEPRTKFVFSKIDFGTLRE